MTQRHYQQQEDLLAPVGSKDVRNYSIHHNSQKLVDVKKIRTGKKNRKPRLKSNFFNQIKVHQSSMKLAKNPKKVIKGKTKAAVVSNVKLEDDTKRAPESVSNTVAEVGNTRSEENVDSLKNDEWLKVLTSDCIAESEDVKKNFILKIEELAKMDSVYSTVVEVSNIVFDLGIMAVRQMFYLEEAFQYVTAIALMSYGGSWTILAGVIAAGEVFGTKGVLTEACKVGMNFIYDDEEDVDEFLPLEIKSNIKHLGLQMSLLIAVIVSPSWAELCITISLASKYACLFPVQEILMKTISKPDSAVYVFETIDEPWFDLLALVASNILSLTVFGCFPRFTTSVYMGYIGVELLMEGLKNNFHMPIDKEIWKNNQMQYYSWAAATMMAMWQAIYGYTGIAECLSGLMFVYPVVKLYNYVYVLD